MKYILAFLFVSCSFLHSQTIVPAGNVNGVWDVSGSPYNITGEITVVGGQSLIIEPGVVINFTGSFKFIILGSITARGTESSVITFTCPDTAVGWKGLRFPYTSTLNDSSIFEHCTIEGGKNLTGTGDEAYGGGVFIRAFPKVRFTDCLFRYNKANYGGAIAARDNASIIIENCTFKDNYARYSGAAIRMHDYSHALIRNNKIFNNNGSGGPGLYCYRSNPLVVNNHIYDNTSFGSGGAINMENANPVFIDNLITGNSAVNGGAVYFAALANPQFINNTIANNTATSGGALYFSNSSSPTFINCVIWGNTASWGTQVYLANDLSDPNFLYCFVQHGTLNFYGTGSGINYNGTYANNIEIDPEFSAAGEHPFSLSEISPGINAGSTDTTGLNLPREDFAGNPRIDSDTIDIGCYEFQSSPAAFQLVVNIQNSWNMVSIPGMHPVNQSANTWWQYRDPGAGLFKFQSGYIPVTTLNPTTGYWMKHLGANTYNTGDEWPSLGILIVPHDPILAAAGWNMIGIYECPVIASSITTTPPGIIQGQIFKYSGGYSTADTLYPGYGYWVKTNGSGMINIPPCDALSEQKNIPAYIDYLGKIIITDDADKSYSLFSAGDQMDLSKYELPPLPPENMFDIRFVTQRYAERLNTPQLIEMRGVTHPVTVTAEKAGIILSNEAGEEITRINAGESVTLNSTANRLMVSMNVIPLLYSLEQNYPNPFNPVTNIGFSIPEDVQNIKLIIYNALGEKVAELLNSALQAGSYNYSWNACDVVSGVYFYQLISESFTSVKKMTLVK